MGSLTRQGSWPALSWYFDFLAAYVQGLYWRHSHIRRGRMLARQLCEFVA